MIVVSKNAVPAKSLQELLAWLKARPAPATAGTAGAVREVTSPGSILKRHRHQAAIRAISRHGAGDE